MFKITQKEVNAVAKIQGVYTSLQLATDKVARSLLFEPAIASASQKSFFNFGSERRKKSNIQGEKVKLLEVLAILKAEIEACLPSIMGDHLYLKCRLVDANEFNTDNFRISEAQNALDMIACFEELDRRMSKMLAFPEVAEVVQNPINYSYCLPLATPNLGISEFFQTYLQELKDDEVTSSDSYHAQNPNTSHRKKIRRSKSKKNKNKHQ